MHGWRGDLDKGHPLCQHLLAGTQGGEIGIENVKEKVHERIQVCSHVDHRHVREETETCKGAGHIDGPPEAVMRESLADSSHLAD